MQLNMGGSDSSITINGNTISVRNGSVYVNGVRFVPEPGASGDGSLRNGDVVIGPAFGGSTAGPGSTLTLDRDGRITGDVHGELHVYGTNVTLVVEGNVRGSISAGGSVTVRSGVTGDVSAGGSVTADKIGGDASAGGSVTADKIGGDATAGGSIRRR